MFDEFFFFFFWEKGKEDEQILATVFEIALACHFLLSMYVVEIGYAFTSTCGR